MNQTQVQDEISYHHYSLTFDPNQVGQRFEDVRFVLVAGCGRRCEAQGRYLADRLFDGEILPKHELETLTKPNSRFSLFKVGPVLVSNHGMGSASMSIALHELFLMCKQARVLSSITLIRLGTCGGIGVPPGTICITTKTVDSMFQDYIELKICMKLVRRPCVIDHKTASLLEKLAREHPNVEELGEYQIRAGTTLATNDFYEEQGRTNGAICDHSHDDKLQFLKKAQEIGVINMEMESNYLAAMCHKLGASFGVVCVALTNRMIDDKVKLDKAEISLFERRLFWLNMVFIRYKLGVPL